MQTKRTVIIGTILLSLIICILFINREALKEGITVSLQEDFKIKESLGQVFFLEGETESQAVSSNITVSAMSMPCDGDITVTELYGEKAIIIDSIKYQSVYATADGIIEKSEDGKITLRHYDGKLSSYYGVGALCSTGDKVKKGESIGYAKGRVTYRLYDNCVSLDPLNYLS